MDEIRFSEGLSQGEYQRYVWRNQLNLRVILPSNAIDTFNINVRIVNQRERHSVEYLNTIAAES